MEPVAVYFHAPAAVLSLLVGLLVVVGRSDRPVNLLLAGFLGVVAASEGAHVLHALTSSPGATLTWFRVQSALFLLMPGLFYWFGAMFPEKNRLFSRPRVGAAVGLSVALAATAPWLHPVGTGSGFSSLVFLAGTLFSGVVYSVVLHQVGLPLIRGEDSRPHTMAYPAFAVVMVQAWPRFTDVVVRGLPDLVAPSALGLDPLVLANLAPVVAPATAITVVASLAAVAFLHEVTPDVRRVFLVGAGVAAGVELLASVQPILQYAQNVGWFEGAVPAWLPGASLAAALTWLIFGLLLSGALLRFRVLDMSLGKRRWGARGLAVFILITGSVLVFRFLAGPDWSAPGGVQPATLGLVLIVFLLSDRFYELADAMGEALYGVPTGANGEQALALYRHGVRQAVDEGDSGLDPRLDQLREELDLDPQLARMVEREIVAKEDRPVGVGETLRDRYEVDALLGRGGAGRTFRARDRVLERDVVLKEVLHGDPEQARRVLDEARTAGQLRHPNIVTVFDVVRRPHSSIIVLEYVPGGSLKTHVEENGPLAPDQGLYLAHRMLEALQAIHRAGVVHRDLKPGNILLDIEGEPQITDFGLAQRDHTRGFGQSPNGQGTPGYMAPEQARGREVTPASDLYAIARVLEDVVDPIPRPLGAVIEPALAEDPARRWASAEAMLDALEVDPDRLDWQGSPPPVAEQE